MKTQLQRRTHAEPRVRPARPVRTGPVGRLARVAYAIGIGSVVYGLWRTGIDDFSDPEILGQTGFWLITAAVVHTLYSLPAQLFGADWGRRVLLGVLALASAAAVLASISDGTPWASPLTWLVLLVELAVAVLVGLAMVLSTILGTPGCEFGAIRELFARVRGVYDPVQAEALGCVVGLRRLDAWEARQPWRSARG
jgi:hypothetical protein